MSFSAWLDGGELETVEPSFEDDGHDSLFGGEPGSVEPQFDDDGHERLFGDGEYCGDGDSLYLGELVEEDPSPLQHPQEQNGAPETAPASGFELTMPQPAVELTMPQTAFELPMPQSASEPKPVFEFPTQWDLSPSAALPQSQTGSQPQLAYQEEPPLTPRGRRFPGNHHVDFSKGGQRPSLQMEQISNISPKTHSSNLMGPPPVVPAYGDTRWSQGRIPMAGPNRSSPATALSTLDGRQVSTKSITRTLQAMANAGVNPVLVAEKPSLVRDSSDQTGEPQKYKIRLRQPPPPPSPPPPPAGRGKGTKKKISNNRKLKNDLTNRPERFYQKLDKIEAWGPKLTEGGNPIFEYWKESPELWSERTYTRDQLLQFFTGATREPRRAGKLTIWIQNTPAQSNERYVSPASGKCRWVGCPARPRTILKGFWRVAFDENSKLTTKGIADPFHNAGYMHLYCFEEIFDLGFLVHWSDLIWGFQVRPDVRALPRESENRMALTRDHRELLEVYEHWKTDQAKRVFPKAKKVEATQQEGKSWRVLKSAREREEKDYLWRRLTDAHLALEASGRAATRNRRGGANIGVHRGDLRKYLGLRGEMKRSQDEEDDDEDSDGDGVIEVPPPKKRKTTNIEVPQPKKQKTAKGPAPANDASSDLPMGANMHPVLNPPVSVMSPDVMEGLFHGTDLSHFQTMPNYDPYALYPQDSLLPAGFNGQNFNEQAIPQDSLPQANSHPPAGFQTFHPPPLEQLHAIHTQQLNRPLTRAISRVSAEAAQNTLASPGLINGLVMDELIDVLAPQPPHIRNQILSGAPAEVAEELQTRLASQPDEATPTSAHTRTA
ncbi:hypothetical protein QBC34DRAFT_426376 [Podospora aff. communis PSN243]|uniref:HMG box domain-containing protein n=1 Tax=Podospora aff. communis PSN243 TaxID=3040156 RepID=A0AAV9GJV3_9PEZI|nr:hypothetical protein QBC34DRAFT_426376 [Podospora aff. communis PSN243]